MQKLSPEDYTDFESYVDQAVEQGFLTEVELKTYTFETLWSAVAKKLKAVLEQNEIKYKMNEKSNTIKVFDITCTESQRRMLMEYIKGVMA